MKNLIILITLILSFLSCQAQKISELGIQKFKERRFIIRDLGANLGKDIISVRNADYKYANTPPPLPKVEYPYPMQKKDFHVDVEKVKSIVFNVLKNKLKILKANSEYLDLDFSFNDKGEPVNIGYQLFKTSLISIGDIKKIDDQIKKEINANFTGTDYLQYHVINYYMPKIIF